MWELLVVFFIISSSNHQTSFDNLRDSVLKLVTEETDQFLSEDQLAARKILWLKLVRISMNEILSKVEKELEIASVLNNGSSSPIMKQQIKVPKLLHRLEDLEKKCRMFGVPPNRFIESCLEVCFSTQFLEADKKNRTKMVEKILIKTAPTVEEGEVRQLEDMLVDISITPNYTDSMTDKEEIRIDFLLESIRIASDEKKSRGKKESAVMVQFNMSHTYRRLYLGFNVEDFAQRIVKRFSWVQLEVDREVFIKMDRHEKIKAVIQAVAHNMRTAAKL